MDFKCNIFHFSDDQFCQHITYICICLHSYQRCVNPVVILLHMGYYHYHNNLDTPQMFYRCLIRHSSPVSLVSCVICVIPLLCHSSPVCPSCHSSRVAPLPCHSSPVSLLSPVTHVPCVTHPLCRSSLMSLIPCHSSHFTHPPCHSSPCGV